MNTHVQYDNLSYFYQAQGYRLVCWAVCLSVVPSQLNVFLYNLYTMSQIETKIGVRVDFNDG